MLGELRFDGGQSLSQLGNIIEAFYIDSDCIDPPFELAMHRAKLLSHLLLKRVNALVNTIETPIHSI
ncbi:MAG: hypothetical protein JO189_01575, partial [Deltaproteobacteria bacterium]|nr:hypothetical protein [Deltaproteobacteria bacterium]